MVKFGEFLDKFLTPTSIMIILIVFVVVLSVVVFATIKVQLSYDNLNKEENKNKTSEDNKNTFDIGEVTRKLEEEMDKDRFVAISDYENEQERKAIISYDELLKNASSLSIEYDDEAPNYDGVKVRKVELNNKPDSVIERKEEKKEQNTNTYNTVFFSYEREEEFLKALKQFRANLQ